MQIGPAEIKWSLIVARAINTPAPRPCRRAARRVGGPRREAGIGGPAWHPSARSLLARSHVSHVHPRAVSSQHSTDNLELLFSFFFIRFKIQMT